MSSSEVVGTRESYSEVIYLLVGELESKKSAHLFKSSLNSKPIQHYNNKTL